LLRAGFPTRLHRQPQGQNGVGRMLPLTYLNAATPPQQTKHSTRHLD